MSHEKVIIKFVYDDFLGNTTSRTVEVKDVFLDGEFTYIAGFCRLRREERTFRPERIIGDIYIPASGMSVSPLRFVVDWGINVRYWHWDEQDGPRQYWGSPGRNVPVESAFDLEYVPYARRPEKLTVYVEDYDGSSVLNVYTKNPNEKFPLAVERILSCIDIETGEEVRDLPEHIKAISERLQKEARTSELMRDCPTCGKRVAKVARHCPWCGHPFQPLPAYLQALKSRKDRGKDFGCGGCLLVVAGFVGLMAVVSTCEDMKRNKPKSGGPPQKINIRAVEGAYLGCNNREDIERIMRFRHLGEEAESSRAVREAVMNERCIYLSPGARVHAVGGEEGGGYLARVRLEGESQSWWVPTDYLEYSK